MSDESTDRPEPRKTGRFTLDEQTFIEANVSQLNYKDIALALNRDPVSVRSFIRKIGTPNRHPDGRQIRKQSPLADKEFWPLLETQFTPPELDMFEYHWKNIFEQFDNDVLPTEELQIIDLIKFEIMMNRNLKEQKDATDSIRALEIKISRTKNKEDLQELERQLLSFKTAQAPLTKSYLEIQEKKSRIFEGLKATRAARIQRIESKKESFSKWIEGLVENSKKRKELGLLLEKFRLAMIDEEIRLAAYHKYEDSVVDQPLIDATTIKEDNELKD